MLNANADSSDLRCIVCSKELSGISEVQRNQHISNCFGSAVVHERSCSDVIDLTEENDNRGLLENSFFCVICDSDLSRRGVFSRCQHLKKCAKENLVSTKQLLELIAPISSYSQIDSVGGYDDQVEEFVPPVAHDSKKDALSFLMSSARHLSKSKGFEGKENQLDTSRKGLTNTASKLTKSGDNTAQNMLLSNKPAAAVVLSNDGSSQIPVQQRSDVIQIVDNNTTDSHIEANRATSVVAAFDTCINSSTSSHVTQSSTSSALPQKNAWEFLMKQSSMSSKKSNTGISATDRDKSKQSSAALPVASSSTSQQASKQSMGITNLGNESRLLENKNINAAQSTSGRNNNRFGNRKAGRGGRFGARSGVAVGNGYHCNAPAYKKIEMGTMRYPIVVDGFQYAHKDLSDCYFLTHFHSDHYTGLTKDFDCGKIYCSPTTSGLVRHHLRVQGCYVIPLQMERKYILQVGGVNVEVTFLDANHCPGAVCILFTFPEAGGRQVLHTGDFRWSSALLRRSAVYRSLSATTGTSDTLSIQRNLVVYLDTTYCDVNYSFPHQDLAINAVVECVRREMRVANTLFLFGAYMIGKERVYMSVAEDQNMKVYVDKARWKTILCYDWSVEEHARLTTDSKSTRLWVVPMSHLNFNKIHTIRKQCPHISRVVAIQPTGWAHHSTSPPPPPITTTTATTSNVSNVIAKNKIQQNSTLSSSSASSSSSSSPSSQFLAITKENQQIADMLSARHKDGNTIYSIPYSEHSSFSELVDFIKTFRPQRVIPTVNTIPAKVETQLALLKKYSGGIYDKKSAATADNKSSTSSASGENIMVDRLSRWCHSNSATHHIAVSGCIGMNGNTIGGGNNSNSSSNYAGNSDSYNNHDILAANSSYNDSISGNTEKTTGVVLPPSGMGDDLYLGITNTTSTILKSTTTSALATDSHDNNDGDNGDRTFDVYDEMENHDVYYENMNDDDNMIRVGGGGGWCDDDDEDDDSRDGVHEFKGGFEADYGNDNAYSYYNQGLHSIEQPHNENQEEQEQLDIYNNCRKRPYETNEYDY